MAEKISWTELRRTIAIRAGVSEKTAGAFLSSLQAQVIEALKTEKQVKINGLGTFKLQAVAPRKSVNVATGEEITIPGYNKVVFNAEAGVKELVEKNAAVTKAKPAAAPKKSKKAKAAAPVSNDPLEKLGAQAAEIVDILGELGQNPKEEAKPAPKAKKAAAKPKKPAKKEAPVVEQAAPVVAPEPVIEPEPVVEPAPVVEPEPVVEPTPEPIPFVVPETPVEQAEEPVEEPKKKKKHHFWRDTLICVIILLILAGVAYYFFRQEIRTWIKDFIDKNLKEQVKEEDKQAADQDGNTASFTEESGVTATEQSAEATPEGAEVVPAQTPAEEAVETIVIEEQVYKKMLKTEAITEGSRLAWIAKKYYGSKIYWPYLYDANKDHLTNPNVIVVGTPIRVPKLTALQKDTTNAQTMATIDHLRQEAEKAMH